MGEGNGTVCCILGVCCPPGSAEQQAALEEKIQTDLGVSKDDAEKHAKWLLRTFDLAPKDSLKSLKAMFAGMVQK